MYNSYNHLIGKQVFMATNDKLIEVELCSEVLTFDNATYYFKHNDNMCKEVVDIRSDRYKNLFYITANGYTNNCPENSRAFEFSIAWRQYVLIGNENLFIKGWVFENNNAVEKNVPVVNVTSYYEMVGEHKNLRYTINTENGVKVYCDREHCLAFNKVIASAIDGKDIPTHTGYMQDLIAYTDEQKKAIEKLRKAIEEVSKTCTFMCSDDGLFVLSGKHVIKDQEWMECNGEDYVGAIYDYHKDAIKLPNIYRNYCDNPVLTYEQA